MAKINWNKARKEYASSFRSQDKSYEKITEKQLKFLKSIGIQCSLEMNRQTASLKISDYINKRDTRP